MARGRGIGTLVPIPRKLVQGQLQIDPIPHRGGVSQLVERVLYHHSTCRAVPERLWVQSLLLPLVVCYGSRGAAADQPGVQDWYIPLLQIDLTL
jgi:hypothetical protein